MDLFPKKNYFILNFICDNISNIMSDEKKVMISDVHVHTHYSHGGNEPRENVESAILKGVSILGFSEHSPRSEKYKYPVDYVVNLEDYFDEICLLKKEYDGKIKILVGIEQDYFDEDRDLFFESASKFDFDFVIVSCHFLGTWGFDHGAEKEKWAGFDKVALFEIYQQYFDTLESMLKTGFGNILAHPDLIKIFSKKYFDEWKKTDEAIFSFDKVLRLAKKNNMAMEISSAGIYKDCGEIYPCDEIIKKAGEIGLDICLNSDAHDCNNIARDFDKLFLKAKKFGFDSYVYFEKGKKIRISF